jgi:hypothetical protein
MKAFELITLLVIGVLQFVGTQADAQPRTAIEVAVEFIIGNCFHTLDDISRVKSAARLFKWEMLPPDAANMLKPIEGTDFEAWHARFEGQHFLIAVNHGIFEGRPAETCSVVADQEPDSLIPRVLIGLKARKMHEDADAVQINEFYAVQHPTERKVLMNIVRARDGRAPVNIGFMSIQ